ncbi:MAG: hypothetical protein PHD51_02175 [Patescibacteria group bacterium]|nr:hypothetical protein [Patescibacteria group bacterium]MDD5490332.1 hypothetical protein [Patescibacteria group bacterium]
MNETGKRLGIIKKLFFYFDKHIFEGILLTGSMVHGKFFSVTAKSDIDVIFIIKKKNVGLIKKESFFNNSKYFVDAKLELLKKGVLFWCDQKINNVKINMGFCTWDYFEKFCNLNAKLWKGSSHHGDIKPLKIKTINGLLVDEAINVKEYKKIFIRTYKNYINNVLVARPFFSNLICCDILFDKNNHIKQNLDKLKKKLIRLYGLDNVFENILDSVLKKCSSDYKKELKLSLLRAQK